ncbi:MAG: ORF6N domain-containing protein [Verrucomicrobiia bacterium]|jgi:hypothetical protein
MSDDKAVVPVERIEQLIYLIRGQKVMLDSDLAEIYGVTTKRLNEQVGRNADRFPSDFAFLLTRQEVANLRSQIATSSLEGQAGSASARHHGGPRYRPRVFTEHGAIMLASVLNSPVAVQASVRVVRAFVRLREMLASNRDLAQKLVELERKFEGHDDAIRNLFEAIRQLLTPPEPKRRKIGFQVRETPGRYTVRTRGGRNSRLRRK